MGGRREGGTRHGSGAGAARGGRGGARYVSVFMWPSPKVSSAPSVALRPYCTASAELPHFRSIVASSSACASRITAAVRGERQVHASEIRVGDSGPNVIAQHENTSGIVTEKTGWREAREFVQYVPAKTTTPPTRLQRFLNAAYGPCAA